MRPIGNFRIVRVGVLGHGHPGVGEAGPQRALHFRTDAAHAVAVIVECGGNVGAVHGAELAAESGAREGPQIQVGGSLAGGSLALGLQVRAAAGGGIGIDLGLNQERGRRSTGFIDAQLPLQALGAHYNVAKKSSRIWPSISLRVSAFSLSGASGGTGGGGAGNTLFGT